MKVITIPEDVTFELPVEDERGAIVSLEQTVSFLSCLRGMVIGHEPFRRQDKSRQFDKVMDVIDAVNGEKVIKFEDADFEEVEKAKKAAVWPHSLINRAYIPFYKAIEEAKTEKPGKD